MAGRKHKLHHPDNFREYRGRDGHRFVINEPRPGNFPVHVHPAAFEEELAVQHREIRRIVSENAHVIDENRLLQRELTAAKDDIHRLGEVIPNLRAEKEQRLRELTQRSLKLEAELRASEPLRVEVKQLRGEVKNLDRIRDDLNAKVQGIKAEIGQFEAKSQQMSSMRDDIELMRDKLVEARRATEHEKKAHEEIFEQNQAMEKNLISMAREIEKLRAEQLNAASAGQRPYGFGGEGYGMYNRTSETGYPGSSLGDGYGSAWGLYDRRGPHRY